MENDRTKIDARILEDGNNHKTLEYTTLYHWTETKKSTCVNPVKDNAQVNLLKIDNI